LEPILKEAVQRFLSDNPGLDADQQKVLSSAVENFLAARATISDESQQILAALFATSSTGSRQAPLKPVSLVTQGKAPGSGDSSFGDKDVSILKLDGFTDLPTLPVASDAAVDGGQQIFIDGYPGGAQRDTLDQLSTPSVTSGTISSKKASDLGVPLLETTATVSPGNSGGPGLNDQGEMIGVVSYGISGNGASYNYLIGASVVQTLLREKNIQPRESAVTHLFDVGLNQFHQHHYSAALKYFQQVKGVYPGHPTVDSLVQRSQEAIQQGKDQTSVLDGLPLVPIMVGTGAAFVLAVVGIATLLIVRSRRRRLQARKQASSESMPGAYNLGTDQASWAGVAGAARSGHGYPEGVSTPLADGSKGATATALAAIGMAARQAPPGVAARYCPNCGNSVSGKRFCDRCGQPMAR
jgi:hypothetical protein